MKIFTVNIDAYYSGLEEHALNVKETMEQLIAKYDLRNKEVLSIGPGLGMEEYWLYKQGCQLTFVDIDQHGTIETYLQRLPASTAGQKLMYYLGDAYDYLKSCCEHKFDVLYTSSLTNDELHRKAIMDKYTAWPIGAFPYLDVIENLAKESVRQDGLFIHQSYSGGVNVKTNPQFIDSIKQQLAGAGFVLVKNYIFQSAHGVLLTIGYKGSKQDAITFANTIKRNPEISRFHGRSTLSQLGCEIVYDLLHETKKSL